MKKLIIALCIVLFPVLAVAAEISSGENVSVEKAQKNPIIFSTTANIKSDIEGDLTVFAQTVNVDSAVSASAYIFGQSVKINSPIGNRLIIASADSVIKSEVKGDLVVLSGNVTIDSQAKIDGDVFAYGSTVNIKGQIAGNLNTAGSKVVFDGALIQGNVVVQSDQISLFDNSQISGSLKYKSTKEMSLPNSPVKGGISFEQVHESKPLLAAYSLIGSMVMLIIAGLTLLWLTRERLDNLVQSAIKNFGKVWLTGFLVAIVVPLAMMILIVSYVGIYAFVILLLLYVLSWVVGYVYGAILLGHLVVRLISQKKTIKVEWAAVVFGPIALILISMIPIVGGLAKFVLTIAGVGMFVEQVKVLRSVK